MLPRGAPAIPAAIACRLSCTRPGHARLHPGHRSSRQKPAADPWLFLVCPCFRDMQGQTSSGQKKRMKEVPRSGRMPRGTEASPPDPTEDEELKGGEEEKSRGGPLSSEVIGQ